MPTIENIKETISKLLALSGSPNEHEAKAALLKARELMAKHKIREADIEQIKDAKVIDRLTNIACTKMTNTWAVRLSNIIADHYCCRSYRQSYSGSKKVTIGLVGLEGDIDICEQILNYAFECIASECKQIRKQFQHTYVPAVTRQMADAYGNGFCAGILQAYREQDSENQEYGLILVTPQPVIDVISQMDYGGSYGVINYEGWRNRFAQQGYRDGVQFDPSTKLTQGQT